MSDSPPESSESRPRDRAPIVRVVLWGLLAAALLAGIILFFRFSRRMTPLL